MGGLGPPSWRLYPGELHGCCCHTGLGNRRSGFLYPRLYPEAEVPVPEHFQAGMFRKRSPEIKVGGPKPCLPPHLCCQPPVMLGHQA